MAQKPFASCLWLVAPPQVGRMAQKRWASCLWLVAPPQVGRMAQKPFASCLWLVAPPQVGRMAQKPFASCLWLVAPPQVGRMAQKRWLLRRWVGWRRSPALPDCGWWLLAFNHLGRLGWLGRCGLGRLFGTLFAASCEALGQRGAQIGLLRRAHRPIGHVHLAGFAKITFRLYRQMIRDP